MNALDKPRPADLVVLEGSLADTKRLADRVRALDTDGEPPCPACGTVGPLVSGACGDCGLQLE
jgi:hypothetical protein